MWGPLSIQSGLHRRRARIQLPVKLPEVTPIRWSARPRYGAKKEESMSGRNMAIAAEALALATGGAPAQSLEKSYGEQCSTWSSKQTEMCQVMAKALLAKLQGETGEVAPVSRKGTAPSNTSPSAAELRARWGLLLDFMGKPTFQIDGQTGTADTASRWVLEWKVPGEVLVRRKLAPDGSELGSTTYTWSRYTATVERNIASIGQIQTFSVDAQGTFTGTLLLNGTMGREKWTSLGATGYRVTSETNEGHGWVLGNDAMWQLPTSDALAGATQAAALMRTMYQNKKEVAEIKAKMQGSMTDEEFDQHIAELTKRNAEYAEARRLKREARAKLIGGIFVAAAGAYAASANGGDGTQIAGGALKGYSAANADDPASAQLSAQADSMIHSGNGGKTPSGASTGGRVHDVDSSTTQGAAEANVGPGAPLRFVLSIGLDPRPGDSVNPTCYSNVITRPGPAGWGQRGFLPSGSAESAHATVQAMRSSFIAACRAASGRNVTSEGDFHWTWNELQDGESQIANSRARYPEDVSVSL